MATSLTARTNCSKCRRETEWDDSLAEKPLCVECWDKEALCQPKYYWEHKTKILEYKRQYYLQHKAEEARKQRERRQTHKVEISESNRLYRLNHKDEIAEYQQRYRESQK